MTTLQQLRHLMPGANLTGGPLPFHDNGLLVELDGWSRWIYVGDEPYPLTDIRSLKIANEAAGLRLTEANVGSYLVLFIGLMRDLDGEPFELVPDSVEVLGANRFGNIMASVCTVYRRGVFSSLMSVSASGSVTMLTDDLMAILPDDQPVAREPA
jgi:hypothetical protein